MKKGIKRFLIPIITVCSFFLGFLLASILAIITPINLLGLSQRTDGLLEYATFSCSPYLWKDCNNKLDSNYRLMDKVWIDRATQKLNEQVAQDSQVQRYVPPPVIMPQTPSLQQIMDQSEQRQLNQEMLKFFQNVNRP